MKKSRRHQILEVLADELESKPGSRITTAALAASVGVSEAALYRHFTDKAGMFEALIEFAESSIFGLLNQVMNEQKDAYTRCLHMTTAVLKFSERNPGIARILVGDILLGEHGRLRRRVFQFFARIETQFRQALRESALVEDNTLPADLIGPMSTLLLTIVTGRLDRFVRSDFTELPTTGLDIQWRLLRDGLFAD